MTLIKFVANDQASKFCPCPECGQKTG